MTAWNDDKNKLNSIAPPKKHSAALDYMRYAKQDRITIVWNKSNKSQKRGK